MAMQQIPGRSTYWMGEALRVLLARALYHKLTLAQVCDLVAEIENRAENIYVYGRTRSTFIVGIGEVLYVMNEHGYTVPVAGVTP